MSEKQKSILTVAVVGLLVVVTIGWVYIPQHPRYIAETIMKDMSNGKVMFFNGILLIPGHKTTDRVIASIFAERGEVYNYRNDEYTKSLVFNIPQGIISYDYIDSWENESEFSTIENIKQSYSKADYLHNQYPTYEKYKEWIVSIYNKKKGFQYISDDTIRYNDIIPERRYSYKVITVSGMKKVQICLLKNTVMGSNTWEVGAIFQQPM